MLIHSHNLHSSQQRQQLYHCFQDLWHPPVNIFLFKSSTHVSDVFISFHFQRSPTQNPELLQIVVSLINKLTTQASAREKSMYPKVKVREQNEDGPDLNSSVTEFEDDSPRSVVRIPNSYISNSFIPMTSLSRGEGKNDNKEKDVEVSKPNIRAISILQPRAVLSSPDNDGMIGNRNKAKAELLSSLKNHNLCQNSHTRCKVIPRRSMNENSITKKGESKEAADSRSELKARKRATIVDPR